MKGKAVTRGLPHSAETIKGKSLRAYQKYQKRKKVCVCVRACVGVCGRACVCARVRVWPCANMSAKVPEV